MKVYIKLLFTAFVLSVIGGLGCLMLANPESPTFDLWDARFEMFFKIILGFLALGVVTVVIPFLWREEL
jgi:hypothetical protein